MDTKVFEENRDKLVGRGAFMDDFVLPDYDQFNVRNIKSIVGKIFGVNSLDTTTMPADVVDEHNGVEKVFLVVMDGFGFNRLLSYVRNHDGALSELISKGVEIGKEVA